MLTSSAPAVQDRKQNHRQGRTRALSVAAGALAGAVAWLIEVPLTGVDLTIRFGSGHAQTIGVGQVIGVSLAAALLGWLLLAVLDKRTSRARGLWVGAALAALIASLALPLTAATTSAADMGLIVMHLVVAAVVIPTMALTSRTR
jgi:hypothetical protein